VVELRQLALQFHRDDAAIAQTVRLAGWRIYVSNATPTRLSLEQSVGYCREECRVERGFHRFKESSLPALPLFLRVPERIKGLMLLPTVALQAITLLEYVARRELAAQQEQLAGLVPGNPKMKTPRPTAELLLSQFTQLHLLIEESDHAVSGLLIEALSPIQLCILGLLGIPATVCAIAFSQGKFQDSG
jgi:transposase